MKKAVYASPWSYRLKSQTRKVASFREIIRWKDLPTGRVYIADLLDQEAAEIWTIGVYRTASACRDAFAALNSTNKIEAYLATCRARPARSNA